VILLRDATDARHPFEVLMLERHGSVSFPGAHAFPGGVVDAGDHEPSDAVLPVQQRWATPEEGDCPPHALPYWMAAVRELFEEVGILLATRNGRLLEGPLGDAERALRTRLLGGERFADLLAGSGLVAATEHLYYFARWVTPRIHPRRFDTRFLVARAASGQEPAADGTETVSATWFSPREALDAHRAGRIALITPTASTLDELSRFASVEAVLDHARGRVVRRRSPGE
jgi:8-oxo-dGTP pyrophosphatase MutT (NUDIX family)